MGLHSRSHPGLITALLAAATVLATSGCAGGPAPTPTESSTAGAGEPTITIDVPASGATVASPVEVSGTANTFEAALTVDVIDAEGDTLCIRHITATSGSGTPGTWATTLGLVPPASDTGVTLRAYEFSAADGSISNLVEQAVTLSSEQPPIIVEAPECGVTVSPGAVLSASGLALVFEAALVVELRDSSGTPVLTQPTMAASGVEMSAWSTELTLPEGLAPGLYDLVAFNESAEDGSIQNEFAVQIRVE